MEIRPAVPADGPGIATVHIRSWQAAYRGLIPQANLDALDDTHDRRAAWWSDAATDPDHALFVAVDEGVVAFASATASRDDDLPDHGELQTIYALPSVWGTGIGHRLHGAVVEALRARGFVAAFAWVLEGNERMLAFCGRQGWTPDGITKDEPWGDLFLPLVRLFRPL